MKFTPKIKALLFALLLLVSFTANATVYSLPWGPKPQFIDANGAPMSSGTLTFYAAGSTTPQSTYTDSTGGVANANPMTLNTRGEPTTEVWLTGGSTYKLVLKDSSGVTVWTVDNIAGINDITISNAPSEWISGPTPTYVSATSFTLAGDQTPNFTVGRRVKTTNSGGTVYGRITSSAFGALTTVVVINDTSAIDSGISAVAYGMLQANNSSIPFTKSGTTGLSSPLGYVNRSALAGLTMSTAGSSATMSIAAGEATDGTNVATIALASAISKTTGSWAVGSGNGCLDTGAIANTTWYHFYVALRLDTGVVDVLCTLSASAPAYPTNYTLSRRIGSGKTDGSAQWVKFIQNGDIFQWDVPVADLNIANPGTSAISLTLTTPTGIITQAWMTVLLFNQTTSNTALLLSDLATTDTTPDVTKAFSLIGSTTSATSASTADFYVNTNVSAQIRYRLSVSGASDIIRVGTKGWIDTRGRNK